MADTVRKNLGVVTAYGYARSKGYTGTEEEFAELMASYSEVAQDAAHSAEEAAQSAQAAAGSVDQVQSYASQAQQSAQAAATSASDAVDAKTGAQEQVQRAYAQAVAAEGSASQSASSAHESAESATAAANSASNASVSAASAQSYADTAAVAAGEASGSAEDAQDSATAASTSAAQAAESARTLTIDTTLTKSGQAADAKKTGDEITAVKYDLSNFADGKQNIGTLATFKNGGLSNINTTPNIDGRKYRVSTTDLITFEEDTSIKAEDGFKFVPLVYADGTYRDNGWKTGTYNVASGTQLILSIARTTENTAEIADVQEFVNAITLPTKIQNMVNKATEESERANKRISGDFRAYVGSNGRFRFPSVPIISGRFYWIPTGSLMLIPRSGGFNAYKSLSVSDIQTQLSDYIQEVDGVNYIAIPADYKLWWDYSDNTLGITSRSVDIDENKIVLLSFASSQEIGGILSQKFHEDYLKLDIQNRLDAQTNQVTALINSSVGATTENLEKITEAGEILLHPAFVLNKGINTSGALVTANKRMGTEEFIDVTTATGITYNIADGYRLSLAFYSESSESAEHITLRYWLTGSGRLRKEYNYIRMTCATENDTPAITLDDARNFVLSVDYPLQRELDENTTKAKTVVEMLTGDTVSLDSKWYQGTPSSYNKTRVFSELFDVGDAYEATINIAEGMQWYITYYNDEGGTAVGRGWYQDSKTFVPEYCHFRVTLSYVTENTNIAPDDITSAAFSISYKTETGIDTNEIIPKYWNASLNNAISQILAKKEIVDSQGDSFVFITDTHWSQNAKNSPKLIKKILKKTGIKRVFFGGDVLTLYSTQSEALSVGRDFFESFGDIEVMSSLGNHDVNNNQGTYGSDAYLKYPQVYSYMFKDIEESVSELPRLSDTNGDGNRNFYYYVDNKQEKIRYIVLNNGKARIGAVQTNWLKTKLTELETGWVAIIFAHEYWFGVSDSIPTAVVQGTDIETAINEIYDSMAGTVGAFIVGHCHFDYSKTSEKGYPIIATTTDAYPLSHSDMGPVMTLGTNTEQAFDVFSVDSKNGKIYATRIGAGESREFDFALKQA